MKIKTFILTFLLMMMSSPIVFGQNRTVTAEVRSFADLDEAIKNASTDPDLTANILLKRDIEYTKRIVIPTGVKVYIDINGFNLTCTNDYAFQNEGDLTIEDNGNYDSQYGWSVARIKSTGIMNAYSGTGKLLLNNVIVENNSGSGVVINNKVGGNVEIINGEIISKDGANSVQNDGFIKMDGTIVRTEYRSFVIGKGSQLILDDTKIYDPNGGYRYDAKFLSAAEINALNNPNNDSNIPDVIIETGETFFVKANVGSIPYPSLKAAVTFAQNNNQKVIDLLYDDVLNNPIEIGDNVEEIVINGNNNTLTSTFNTENQGVFNIKSSADGNKIIIKDLNIATTNNTERAINVAGKSNVELNNVTAEGFKYTINVPNSGAGCTIATKGGEYSGYAAVNITTEATFTAEGTKFVGINNVPEHPSNNYAVIAVNATNPHKVNIDIDADSEITAIAENSNKQFILTSDCDESVIKIAAKLNHVNGDIINGDVEGNEVAFHSDYRQLLIDQGYAVSESEYDGMISVDGFAVATIGEQTYTSLENAYKEVVNGQTITLLGDDKTLQNANALNYPVVGDTEYATDFTFTTKEGYEFNAKSGFKFIFNNGVNVTFKDADINAVLNPNNSTVTLAGVNDIKTLMSTGTAKFYVAEGEQTIGTLMGELNVTGEPTLAINAVGNGGSLVMNGATLNGTLPNALNVTAATGENNIINAAINKANFTVAEGATVTVNADMTDLASLTVNGKMNAAANVGVNPAEATATTLINGTFEIAGTDKVASIYRNVTLNGTINVKDGATFKQSNTNYNFTFGNGATINVAEGSTFNGGNAKVAAETVVNLNFDGNASLKSAPTAGTVNLNMANNGQKFTTPEITKAELNATTVSGRKVIYADGGYIVVEAFDTEHDVVYNETLEIGYQSLAEALEAAENNNTIVLLNKENTVINMAGAVNGNKTITITTAERTVTETNNEGQEIEVKVPVKANWGQGWLFVGRGGEGDGTLIFEDAFIESVSYASNTATGFNVSGSKYGNDNTNDGTITIKNSNIELDYLINKNVMSLENSTLTVKNGFSVGGRPGHDKDGNQDSESGEDATATMTLTNGSNVIVDNHNGMGLGYEAIGIMNIDETSSFEATQNFLVSAKGTMNLAGEATIAAGKTLTNNGTINLTNTNAKLYTETTNLDIKTNVSDFKVVYNAATTEPEVAAHYALVAKNYTFDVTDAEGNLVAQYETFPQAIDAATDNQIVVIKTNGPIQLGSNKSQGLTSKNVTVKTADHIQSVFVDYYNRKLEVNNGATIKFDGVKLLPLNADQLNARQNGFVVNNGGTVEFVNGADITADYITVNEGGTININDSKVNVNGTFINNNVVNVEGISDIYVVDAEYQDNKLERGNGNYYMSNVTMNNTLLRGARVTFTEGENNIGNSEFRGVFDINENVTVVTGEEAFIKAVVASVTNVIKGELVVNSRNATTFNLLNVTENGKVTFNEGTTLNLFNSLTNAGEFTFSGVEATSENIILNNGSKFTVSAGSAFEATSTFKFDGNVTLNIDGTVSTVNSTLVDGANVTLNMNVDGAKFTTPQIVGVTTNCEAEGYKIVYFGDAYQVVGNDFAPMDNVTIYASIDEEGNLGAVVKGYPTFAEALANVTGGQVIKIRDGVEGDDEQSVEIDYNKDIVFTITGEAPDYKLPTVTFQNTTVNIVNSNITIAELDARQNATINVKNSDVKTCGNGSTDGIAKSYFNGRIVIDNSTVYAHQATTMGYIDIVNGGKLNVTWQTNIYGNGLITVVGENTTDPLNIVKSTLQTAAFNLTGQPYNDRDNTDLDRVGKPATVVVDGAVLIAGDVINNNGANYSYEVDSYGINIGTEGKAALLDIKNGSSVEFAMNPTGNHSFKSPIIGANGTVNIDASTLVVKNRIANSTDICKLQNNGVVYVTGESDINASVEDAGWFYMNDVTMSAATELLGAKVRFASGTNNLVGSTIDDGYFQVGIGAYEGVDENVDTDNGVIVNVSDNANVGASGATYAGWIGTGFYDSEEDKAAAMTEGVKYVLNINNSIAEFGYFHVSNDGELNVNGNAANKVNYNGSSYTFYAGDFIINGTATFDATDVLALYTKVSCDNGSTETPGTLNIINTEYEAERHNGAVDGINFDVRKTGVVNAQGADTELYLNEYTSIAKDAKFNVKENANVTALGTITNNGAIDVLAGTMTTGTDQIDAINNTSTGAITVAQGSTLDANTNITNRGKLIVNGTLNADANLYAYDNAEAEFTVNGNLTQPQNGDISISLTHNSNYNLQGNYNFAAGAVVNVNKITSSHSTMLLNIGEGAKVTAKSMNLNGSIEAISPAFINVEDDIVCYNTITITDANLDNNTRLKSVDENHGIIFKGTNTLDKANLTGSKVTVNGGAKLTVSAGSYNNINVASLTNNGEIELGTSSTLNVASLTNSGEIGLGTYSTLNVSENATNYNTGVVNLDKYSKLDVEKTLTNWKELTIGQYAEVSANEVVNKGTTTVNGTLTATKELSNVGNATIEGDGNIKANDATTTSLANNGEIKGNLKISATTIFNYNSIDVAEIVATDFFNTNISQSSVIVDDATLQSVTFTNSGTVNVSGESVVKITNEVTEDSTGNGQFVMEGVNLTSSNTNLHGAYIVFNGENSATNLTFSGRNDVLTGSGIQVNGTLNIYGEVTANHLGTGEGTVVLKETTSKLTANSGLKLYPEEDPFVITDVDGYHVVQGTDNLGLPNGVYTLKSNDAYVAMNVDTEISYETIQGAIDAATDGNEIKILHSVINESEIKVEDKDLTFVSDNDVVVNGTFTAQAEVTFEHAVQFEKLYVNATDARLFIENGAAVTVTGATIMSLTSRIVLSGDAKFYTTDSTLDKVISNSPDFRAIYNAAGKYYYLVSSYVAEVGGVKYPTLQEAIDAANVEANEITLLAEYGQPIPMNACVEGKEVIITTNDEEIAVDWSKGSLFVGRHADNTISGGDATLKFENAKLVSTSFETLHSNGLNISGRHKDGHAYNGTVNVVNSTIEVDYILVRNAMNIENSKVVVKGDNGYTTPAGSKCNVLIGGRPDNETTTQDHATAKLNLVNSTLEVENHIRTNYEGRGEMNIDATSTVVAESIYAPRLSKVNSEGNIFARLEEQIANLIVLKGGVYTEDVNAFCATGYSAYPCEYETEYPFTSFWAVRESHGSQTIVLSSEGQGWNWISSYMSNFNLANLQDELGSSATQIWSFNKFSDYYADENEWNGSLISVSPAELYKVQVTEDKVIELAEGDYVDYGTYEIDLEQGWNWIGYPVTKSMSIEEAFTNPSENDMLKKNGKTAVYRNGTWRNSFILEPGQGYMYKNEGEPTTFTYPNNVSAPVADEEEREVSYWNAPLGYASNMTMVAMVNIDGEFVDGNYEVAAFANGELRGSARPIFVEEDNAYVLILTIQGDKVEELTFKYYDVNYGTEYELDNRINYSSDAIVGSFDEPYVLTMNITDIEEVTLSDINIYPNPTTTGVQVNLDATCEKVEIFNALGVKVAEYQNVDSIDAFETAGIYVIRLTNGGEIKHTRLVVK